MKTLIDSLLTELIGNNTKTTKIVRINSDNLHNDGDFWFSSNLLAWRGLIQQNQPGDIKNILHYYLCRKEIDISNFSDEEIIKKAIDLIITKSEDWSLKIEKGCLQRERICFFLNRQFAITKIIKEVNKSGKNFGQSVKMNKNSIFLQFREDSESNLTTKRLEKLKTTSERILRLKGYEISEKADEKYILTTKSQGIFEEGFNKCICGVVKNPELNSKETSETYDSYLQRKIEELEELREGSGVESRRIAEAIITFEMLGVKPSRPSFIEVCTDSDKSIASNRGGSFVLYNAARIEAILSKFKEECALERYPEIWDIDDVDFARLSSEDEWNLIYNFLLGYPEVITSAIQHESTLNLCPQFLCSFLSQLSQKFSVYYRRTRILTEGRDHLIPTMMARIYLLRALQIVINNALELLDITPISRM